MSSDAERLREMADTLEPGSTHLEPFRRELREIAARATLAAREGEIVRLRRLWSGGWVEATRERRETLEEAARLHENIDPASDRERAAGSPGSGAMAAVIEYRDAIRALAAEARIKDLEASR